MAISRHVWMIAGSTERVKSRRFRTVRVVVSSLSTVARSMGASPLRRFQARTRLAVDTAHGVWQHSTRNRKRAQSRGGTPSSSPQHFSVETVNVDIPHAQSVANFSAIFIHISFFGKKKL